MTTPTILIASNLQKPNSLRLDLLQSQWKLSIENDLTVVAQRVSELTPDLVLFELGGLDLVHLDRVRNVRMESVIPLLLLTSINTEEYLIAAYKAGVDECILQPIGPALLYAKLKAWLRHSRSLPVSLLDPLFVGKVRLTPADRTVIIGNGKPIRLTNLEFRLLFCLLGRRNHVMTTEELCHRLWLDRGRGDATALKHIIYRVRRKIEPDPHVPQFLRTIAAGGYEFVV